MHGCGRGSVDIVQCLALFGVRCFNLDSCLVFASRSGLELGRPPMMNDIGLN